MWLCFSFFFWTTAALAAIQSFAGAGAAADVRPAAVDHGVRRHRLHAVRRRRHGASAASWPRAPSGWNAIDRRRRCGRRGAAAGWWPAAGCRGWRPRRRRRWPGLGTGLAGPSRDMLIKPRRAAGRHRPRLRHRLLGAGRRLRAGRAGLRRADAARRVAARGVDVLVLSARSHRGRSWRWRIAIGRARAATWRTQRRRRR
ncbi:MAG: hypothetical protein MZW92_16095 [Comamonadaceae bacterium]|nr:hypothetical protein [Comamonadaceae bacterium]